jgi:hypothetical protein
MNNDQVFALVVLGFFALVIPTGLIVLVPVAKAWARKMSARFEPESDPGEMEEMRGRLQELEERLDFAERLIASSREAGQLETAHE